MCKELVRAGEGRLTRPPFRLSYPNEKSLCVLASGSSVNRTSHVGITVKSQQNQSPLFWCGATSLVQNFLSHLVLLRPCILLVVSTAWNEVCAPMSLPSEACPRMVFLCPRQGWMTLFCKRLPCEVRDVFSSARTNGNTLQFQDGTC